jgi:hypothetical protein
MAANPDQTPHSRHVAGLCADCAHAQRVESSRGSIFYLCKLSVADPAYPKYPRLPVMQCSGYVPKT